MHRRAAAIVPLLAFVGACAEPAPPTPAAPTPPTAAPTPPAAAAPVAPATASAAVAPATSAAAPPAPATHSGEAVYYDANARGACSLTFGKNAAVLSAPNVVYNKIEACGQCLEVSGPAGKAVIQVVDRCNTCADDLLVINKPAFDQIAGTASSGRERITWREVACDVKGPFELRIKKSSSAYWTAIQIRNHRRAIRGVSFKKGDDWVPMARSNDNYFVAEKGVGAGGFTLRIVSTDGQTVDETVAK
jgi:expansin (peptidoglycan-binding protein)